MKPRRGPVEQSAKHQLKFLVQELKRPGESVAELYIRALIMLRVHGKYLEFVKNDRIPD